MTLDEEARRGVRRAVDWLKGRRRVLFITGAGVSADSGLPTYRGVGGLYNDGQTEEGIPIEEALSGPMLRRRPELTWRYLLQVEEACRGARPNRGHEAIAELERHVDHVQVLTQNVDGFHGQAGSSHVIDIHGDMHDLKCTVCSFRERRESYETVELPPRCPQCGEALRPDVVLFSEMLPTDKLAELERQLSRGFDVVFTVGTTSVFPYIAAPVYLAKQSGTPTVEINPGDSEVSRIVDLRIRAGAALVLGAMLEALA